MMNIVTKDQFNKESEAKGKVIINQSLARQIMSYIDKKPTNELRVIDIKPDKNDRNKTVTVFEDNEHFQSVLSSILENNKKKREEKKGVEVDQVNQIKELNKKIEELTRRLNGEE